jgi:alkylation response protein AidB-like acyl-CoA dehydrogenase
MSERAQNEIWGENPDARVCTVTFPRGGGTRVPGGRVLNGLWPFASGCLHAQWCALSFMMLSEDGQMEGVGLAMVPMSDIVIRDDWNVSGFRGTGSNTLEVNGVFVPDHRIASLDDLVECRPAYEKADPKSLYHGAALSSVFGVVAFGPLIGMTAAACEVFTERLPGREVAYSMGAQLIDSGIVRYHLADARMASDVARIVAADINAMLDAEAMAGSPLSPDQRARVRASLSWCSRKGLEAVQLLMSDSGGRGIADANPLPRILRDLQAFHNHGIINPFQTLESWGAMLVGATPAILLR